MATPGTAAAAARGADAACGPSSWPDVLRALPAAMRRRGFPRGALFG